VNMGQSSNDVFPSAVHLAAVSEASERLLPALEGLGYRLIDAGMRNRLFLRRRDEGTGQAFHLHIVELATWDERKERLMRDYLLEHPEAVKAYGDLKDRLAATYANDSLAYTEAKTAFIQDIVDKARDARGLPRVDVRE
jgi:GrpB-like predicted nucleotidyltransferase (UPF0157 family)